MDDRKARSRAGTPPGSFKKAPRRLQVSPGQGKVVVQVTVKELIIELQGYPEAAQVLMAWDSDCDPKASTASNPRRPNISVVKDMEEDDPRCGYRIYPVVVTQQGKALHDDDWFFFYRPEDAKDAEELPVVEAVALWAKR